MGGVSKKDIFLVDQLNRRSILTLMLSLTHSYIFTEWFFQSRIIKIEPFKAAKLHAITPYFLYPLCLVGCLYTFFSKSKALNKELDRKYTPLYLEATSKLLD
mmetsp:Transcript_8425/g.14105  ORF Transcript_8425/g.14105 Transcript_8425/m.14105 type:complete len:102 (-) Transcript_8425:154-459(-)